MAVNNATKKRKKQKAVGSLTVLSLSWYRMSGSTSAVPPSVPRFREISLDLGDLMVI